MKAVISCLIVCGICGVLCNPRRLLDCNNFDCDKEYSPVCGTDGQTYSSQCMMDMENKRRICWIGHFNMIYPLHVGPCNPTSTAAP